MIVMAVIGGVIVAGVPWAGWRDYRRRRAGARPSVAENSSGKERLTGNGSARRGKAAAAATLEG